MIIKSIDDIRDFLPLVEYKQRSLISPPINSPPFHKSYPLKGLDFKIVSDCCFNQKYILKNRLRDLVKLRSAIFKITSIDILRMGYQVITFTDEKGRQWRIAPMLAEYADFFKKNILIDGAHRLLLAKFLKVEPTVICFSKVVNLRGKPELWPQWFLENEKHLRSLYLKYGKDMIKKDHINRLHWLLFEFLGSTGSR